MLKTLQNFYKATITTAWAAGTGNRYIDVLPTPSSGTLVINPSNTSKREIVNYSAKGTDGGGNYITLSTRGVGGTSDQTHAVNESVRMNITAEMYTDIQTELDLKLDDSVIDTDVTLAANSDTKVASQKATKAYALPSSYLDIDPTLAADSDTKVPSQKAIKEYADALAIAGSPNASESAKGIVEIATDAQVTTGTDTGETGAKLVVLPSQLSSVNSKAYTAGEALTANDTVILASGSESAVVTAISTTNTVEDTTNGWWYQSFVTGPNTTKVVAITMRVNTGGGASSYTYRLRSTPAGSDLDSIGSGTLNVGDSELTLTFASPVTVTPSTTYYIVVTGPRLRGGTTSSYSGGVSGTSADSGANWTTPATTVTGDFYFKVFEGYCVAGNVYKASTDSSLYVGGSWQTNWIGFAKTTVSSGASVSVQVGNVYTGLSGLTPGAVYYLSNTAGAIASSAGTVSKKVGLADSATSLLIKHDN